MVSQVMNGIVVWGSLQGEIWEKTEEYWDTYSRG